MFAINAKVKEKVIDCFAAICAKDVVEALMLDQSRSAAVALYDYSQSIRGFEKLCEIVEKAPAEHKDLRAFLDEHVGFN